MTAVAPTSTRQPRMWTAVHMLQPKAGRPGRSLLNVLASGATIPTAMPRKSSKRDRRRLVEAMDAGKVSVSAAAKIADQEPEQQDRVVEQIEAGEVVSRAVAAGARAGASQRPTGQRGGPYVHRAVSLRTKRLSLSRNWKESPRRTSTATVRSRALKNGFGHSGKAQLKALHSRSPSPGRTLTPKRLERLLENREGTQSERRQAISPGEYGGYSERNRRTAERTGIDSGATERLSQGGAPANEWYVPPPPPPPPRGQARLLRPIGPHGIRFSFVSNWRQKPSCR